MCHSWQGIDPGEATLKLFLAGAEPNFLEFDISWFILAIFKHSKILEKRFLMIITQFQVTTNLRCIYIETLYKVHMVSFIKMVSIDSESLLKI